MPSRTTASRSRDGVSGWCNPIIGRPDRRVCFALTRDTSRQTVRGRLFRLSSEDFSFKPFVYHRILKRIVEDRAYRYRSSVGASN